MADAICGGCLDGEPRLGDAGVRSQSSLDRILPGEHRTGARDPIRRTMDHSGGCMLWSYSFVRTLIRITVKRAAAPQDDEMGIVGYRPRASVANAGTNSVGTSEWYSPGCGISSEGTYLANAANVAIHRPDFGIRAGTLPSVDDSTRAVRIIFSSGRNQFP